MKYGVLFLSNGWGAFCSEMITSDSWSITGEGKRLLIVGSSQTRIGQKNARQKVASPITPPATFYGLPMGIGIRLASIIAMDELRTPQSRQSAKLFSSRRNWDSPNPSPAGECAPLRFWGEKHTLWRARGWESPNSDEGTYTVVLFIYMYFVAHPFQPFYSYCNSA